MKKRSIIILSIITITVVSLGYLWAWPAVNNHLLRGHNNQCLDCAEISYEFIRTGVLEIPFADDGVTGAERYEGLRLLTDFDEILRQSRTIYPLKCERCLNITARSIYLMNPHYYGDS
ncbi:MAG: hypothetical protein FWE90_06695 [Defluviitaleaceae bacterium]|nr:hypothetical protein [Defluviitaleaceae bacterium]